MPIITLASLGLASLIHIVFFTMESILWMNPKVHEQFGMRSITDAKVANLIVFNQGFYNLFLALLGIAAFILICLGKNEGYTVGTAACAVMLGAAIVLFCSAPSALGGALIQGIPPLV